MAFAGSKLAMDSIGAGLGLLAAMAMKFLNSNETLSMMVAGIAGHIQCIGECMWQGEIISQCSLGNAGDSDDEHLEWGSPPVCKQCRSGR